MLYYYLMKPIKILHIKRLIKSQTSFRRCNFLFIKQISVFSRSASCCSGGIKQFLFYITVYDISGSQCHQTKHSKPENKQCHQHRQSSCRNKNRKRVFFPKLQKKINCFHYIFLLNFSAILICNLEKLLFFLFHYRNYADNFRRKETKPDQLLI